MENSFRDRLKHAWNAFNSRAPTDTYTSTSMNYVYRSDRTRVIGGSDRSIVTSVFNRIALDASNVEIKHCRLDENGQFLEEINSHLNDCLNLEANIDQTGRAFIHDAIMSMLIEGHVAIVPTDTMMNPKVTGSYDILSMRTGKVLEWYPKHVKVLVYNEEIGKKVPVVLPKSMVAIIENPLYSVINEPNSTMQRLIRKLALLDITDERASSNKLDLIIQLPYQIKTTARDEQARKRKQNIEDQLTKSDYGIAYLDATEKITQLNRPVENNLMKQVEYLTSMMFSQIGMTQSILDGTADEQTMMNYNGRIVEPMISAIIDEMKRKFLTKTARSQKQSIKFFIDPFKLVPVSKLADVVDKYRRNEVATPNEFRQVMGWKPSKDPKADQLANSNMPQTDNSKSDVPVDENQRLAAG